MNLLDEVKGFYWLRRIAIALEKQNDLIERHIKLKEDEWASKHAPLPRKKNEFSIMDQEEINKDFERRIQAERDGIELDD